MHQSCCSAVINGPIENDEERAKGLGQEGGTLTGKAVRKRTLLHQVVKSNKPWEEDKERARRAEE